MDHNWYYILRMRKERGNKGRRKSLAKSTKKTFSKTVFGMGM